jgi:putative ABC transport system permease protein
MTAGVLAEINLTEMRNRLSALGGNLLVISPNKLPPFPGRPRQLEHFISLVPEDGVALKTLLSESATVVPVVARETTIRFGNRAARVRLIGTVPEYLNVRRFTLETGRFLSTTDDNERVVVLGAAASRELAPYGLKPGNAIFLGGNPYTVIGILHPQGVNFAGEDEDHQVFIPLTSYQRRISNRPWLSLVYVQLSSGADSRTVAPAIQTLLRQRHGRWDYEVDDTLLRNLADIAEEQSGLLTTVVWVVSVTSALLLLRGVIGIATLMILVVRQRQSEIGLRRALGATPPDIAFQFFLEGLVLAIAGVAIGFIVGAASSAIITYVLSLHVAPDYHLALIGILISLVASAAACVMHAALAARLQPSEALRA